MTLESAFLLVLWPRLLMHAGASWTAVLLDDVKVVAGRSAPQVGESPATGARIVLGVVGAVLDELACSVATAACGSCAGWRG